MKTVAQDLTRGPLGRQILFFSLPLVASNLLQVLFNMADIAVVGRFCGAAALGAVGSTTTLVVLFTGFLIGMGGGVNALVARYFGAGSHRDVAETVHTAVVLCFAMGLAVLAFGEAAAVGMLRAMNTRPELLADAALYLRVYFAGMPALALFNFGNGVYSAVGNTKKPLYYLLGAGVINVALNLVFVVGVGLGVAGVAIASAVSQWISAALILAALLRTDEVIGLRRSQMHPSRAKAAALLRLGVPAGCQNAIFQLANLFIQAGVNSFDATMVAGNSAAANADALVYDTMSAFYTACASFVGQNYGAGKVDRMRRSFRVSFAYAFGAAAVMGVALVLLGRPFLGLFTTDPAVVEAGMRRLTIMGFSYMFSALMDNAIAGARGLGETVTPTVIVILGSCVFRVIWVYTIFAWFHTIPALYSLYVFSWTITGLAEYACYRRVFRRRTALLQPAAVQ